MKELFLLLLNSLKNEGNILEANLYRSGNYSSVTVETENGKFSITVAREKEDGINEI